jgi:hypothetical protein
VKHLFVQATKSRKNGKTYASHLVRKSFRTPNGPRSSTICNSSKLPPLVRHLITSALSGKATLQANSIELDSALDFGGLAVLVDAWKSLNLDLLLADIGTPRQCALLKAMVFARLARQWRLCGETGQATRILRQLQTIRLGSIHLKNEGLQVLQITKVPADLNAQLAKLKLLHLFTAPPAWAKKAEPTQP